MIDEVYHFYSNLAMFRAKGFVFSFRVYPRKKVIQLKQKFVADEVSPKEFHKTMNRVLKVIRSFYNFD